MNEETATLGLAVVGGQAKVRGFLTLEAVGGGPNVGRLAVVGPLVDVTGRLARSGHYLNFCWTFKFKEK